MRSNTHRSGFIRLVDGSVFAETTEPMAACLPSGGDPAATVRRRTALHTRPSHVAVRSAGPHPDQDPTRSERTLIT